jgi:hypothetical protein
MNETFVEMKVVKVVVIHKRLRESPKDRERS